MIQMVGSQIGDFVVEPWKNPVVDIKQFFFLITNALKNYFQIKCCL